MNAPQSAVALARPEFAVGLFRDLPAEAYHACEALSASGAKKLLQSPAHYKLWRDEPSAPTPQMQFGTAVHAGVLEPDTFAAAVVAAPEINKRTKAGAEEWAAFVAANAGRIALSAEDYARCLRCVAAVRAHPAATALLTGAEVELSLFWRDAKLGVPCKARYDARNHGGIVDLKTTQDASPEGFARQIASLRYHLQAAHYFSGAEHVCNETPRFFAFIAVESEPPHAVACYALPGAAILAGAHLAGIAAERYARALAAGAWPGYAETIETIHLPRWAMSFAAQP